MKYSMIVIALVILVAGCTGTPTPIQTNNGLVIRDFFIDPTTVLANGRPFSAVLEFENVGGTTATDVQAQLLGVTFSKDGGNNVFNQNDLLYPTIAVLRPPDAVTNAPGETAVARWDWRSPTLPEGLTHTYPIIGRISYYYATSAAATIQVYNEDEYNRKKLKGEAMSAPIVVSNTAGPVKVSVEGVSPIVVKKNEQGEYAGAAQKVFLKLHFLNVGDGVPITEIGTMINSNNQLKKGNGAEEVGLLAGTIQLEGDATFVQCIDHIEPKIARLPTEDVGQTPHVDIRQGKSVVVPCTIEIDPRAWSDKPQGTITLIFDLHYKYYIEKEATLTVQSP